MTSGVMRSFPTLLDDSIEERYTPRSTICLASDAAGPAIRKDIAELSFLGTKEIALDLEREQEGEARPNQMMFAIIVSVRGTGAVIATKRRTTIKRTLLQVKRILEGEPSLSSKSKSHTLF